MDMANPHPRNISGDSVRSAQRLHPAISLLVTAIALAITSHASAQSSNALPPPPRAPLGNSDTALPDSVVHLELVVNGLPSGQVVPVTVRGGRFHVDAATLKTLHVQTTAPDEAGQVAVDLLPEVSVRYDSALLRLLIQVPTEWLPAQHLAGNALRTRQPARSSNGLLFNYTLYHASPQGAPASTALWNEFRVFGRFGIFSSTGVWQHGGAPGSGGYRRYDTRWQYSDEDRMLTWEVGDLVTRTLAWNSTVRLGGVQLSRDFSVRPDVVTYPLPQFAGEAAVPTAVDLFINGQRASSVNVDPGPFALTNVPFINGAGNASVVITDALGRQVTTSVPFYVASDLLRPGLSDYAVALGAIRRDYGLDNASYGPAVAQGSYRRGINTLLTLEGHVEAGEGFGLAGAGAVLRLGQAGVLNGAYSQSRHEKRTGETRSGDSRSGASRSGASRGGSETTLGYQYSRRRFNLTAQHSRRTDGFIDLASVDRPEVRLGRRSNTTATASVSLGRHGSLGLGYFAIEDFDRNHTRLLNLSWSGSPWRNASLYLSANRELGNDSPDSGQWSALAQLVVPLGRDRGSIGTSLEQRNSPGEDNRNNLRVHYNRPIPSRGGFGWNLAYSHPDEGADTHQADLSWRNDHVMLRGGVYGSTDTTTHWGEASGSLVAMDGSWFAANRISDSFVVVDAGGQPGVPVRFENQTVGTTGRDGRLLVPWASAYYAGKFEIDPLQLPTNVETPVVEQRVAVRRGSGYLLEFPVKRVIAANIVLHEADGKPVAVGSIVSSGDSHSYVGWDGLVYLSGLQSGNDVTVQRPDGSRCQVAFELDTTLDQTAQIGPLTCR